MKCVNARPDPITYTITYTYGDPITYGLDGDDTLYGNNGDEVLDGVAANDEATHAWRIAA